MTCAKARFRPATRKGCRPFLLEGEAAAGAAPVSKAGGAETHGVRLLRLPLRVGSSVW